MTAIAERGELGDRPAVELLCDLAVRGVDGKLELTDGRKKWHFYLQDGALKYSQSNLKTEQLKALKASAPEADARELLQLQATVRLMNVSEASGLSWSWSEGEAAPKNRPADLWEACWRAVQRRLSDDALRARLASVGERFPAFQTGGLATEMLPLSDGDRQMLVELDGQRHLDDVLDFSSSENPAAALYMGWLAGAVAFNSRSQEAEVSATELEIEDEGFEFEFEFDDDDEDEDDLDTGEVDRPEPPAASPATGPAGGFDIGALLAQQTGVSMELESPAEETDTELDQLQTTLARLESSENHFDVLGINWDADEQSYRGAYFQLAREFHPDRWGARPQEQTELAERILARVNEAWEVLGDAETRKTYVDSVIHGIKSEDELAMEKVQAILAAENEFKVAMQHFRANRLVQAHEIFERIAEAVPEENEYKAYYGYLIFKMNFERDPEAAERGADMVKEAIDNAKKLQSAWILMGQIYNHRDMPDMAKRCFTQTLKLNPSNQDALREMNRMKRQNTQQAPSGIGGWLSGLFGRKKS